MPSLPWTLLVCELGLIGLSVGALILDLFLKDDAKRGRTLANVAMLGIAVILFQLCSQWGQFGTAFGGSFVQDGVSFFFKLLFLLAGFFVVFMARDYQDRLKRGHGEFILLILFSLVGMSFLASANDFLLLFVSIEILTLSLYIMTAYLRDSERSIEAGVKYLILGALSTALFLYGLSFVYGTTGSTQYTAIQSHLLRSGAITTPFLFGMLLVLCSMAFKIAAVPFQLWAPDVYEGAPTPVTAYLAIGSKAAGFAALVRLVAVAFGPAQQVLSPLFASLAALTILYGNLGAIPQTNLKRLMGYSSIGHAGYLLIGLAAWSHSGNEAILYYLFSYLFSTAGFFLVLIALSSHLRNHDTRELAGLSKRSPLLAAGVLISLLSLAGVPPLAGFFAKFYILLTAAHSGLLWLVVIGVLNVVTSLFYYLKVIKAVYLDPATDQAPVRLSIDQRLIQYLSIFCILAIGIYQEPLMRLVKAAVWR